MCTAACTDHDLTGQLMWPGAHILGSYLRSLPADAFAGAEAVELGAGTGLAGLIFAARGGRVVLTDSNPVVMSLLRRNAEHNAEALGGRASVAALEWGDADAAAVLLAGRAGGYSLLLAADVIYPGSQGYLPALMDTLRSLLGRGHRPRARLLLAYVSRVAVTDRALWGALHAAGFATSELEGTRSVEGCVEGAVFEVVWADEAGWAGAVPPPPPDALTGKGTAQATATGVVSVAAAVVS